MEATGESGRTQLRKRSAAVAGVFAVAMAVWCAAALAGGPQDTRVSGTIDNTNPNDGVRHETFSCFGMPTCTGTHTVTSKPKNCSNGTVFTNDAVFSGLDLSVPGTISGTQTLPVRVLHTVNADGTCTYASGAAVTWPFTATWNGTSGVMDISATHQDGTPRAEHGTFTANVAAASPVFPMTVMGSITTTAVNANAQIQPRPQDVGTQGSIFVFAHAPSSVLKSADDKRAAPEVPALTADEPVVCVLAQVNGQGQLVAVSASSMQAYLTGILSSQTQAVAILTNMPPTNVAGATFFVGYGASALTMLTNGIFQAAITVPGQVQCSASLASAPAPQSPGALTGLWWNATESGWGIHFTQRGPNIFGAWYTYDGAGNPKWYVLATCTGFTGASGICNGPLYQVTGPPFFGGTFNPSLVNATNVGSAQVNFRDVNNVSMTYTVAGQTRTIALVRQPLATGTTPPAVDYTDLWWNPSESGWGMAMAQQFGITFLAWYVYDNSGRPTWRVATCTMSGSSCSGTLYRTTGPVFGPSFDPAQVQATAAGTILVIFTDANNAILTYTVGGVTTTKSITRQLF
jgi:hypothetical protein